MKKLMFSAVLGITLFAVSCAPNKEKTRTSFIDKCKTEAYKGATNDEQKKLMDDYCTCAADKILAKFSTSEIADMEKPEKQAEIQEKMMPVIQPCLDELTNKLMSTMQLEAPAPAAAADSAMNTTPPATN